jgi:hypothetical protein
VFIEGFIVHGGIDLLDSHDIVIQNNLLPRGGGIHLGGDASRRNLVANNTVIEPRAAPIRLTGRASHNVLFNNLLVGPRSIADESGQNSVDARSNLRRTSADGLFAAAGDFHLARKSPAIHAGRADCDGRCAPGHDIEGIRRFARLPCAGAYDIGPFEPPPGRLDK